MFNGEEFLCECVESVLGQTFSDFEFIIINDGSTDNSGQLLRGFSDARLRLVERPNRGLAVSLNEGIRIARGTYIARIDADDICLPNRFEVEIAFLKANPRCVAVGSPAIVIDRDGNTLYESPVHESWERIKSCLPQVPFFHSSVMFSRKVALECGGYPETVQQFFEDQVLWNRMAGFGDLRNVSLPLIKYRLVPSSITNYDTKTVRVLSTIARRTIASNSISKEDLSLLGELKKKQNVSVRESNYYLRIGKIFIENRFDRKAAILNLVRSIKFSPANFTAWWNLALVLLPQRVISFWKARRSSQL